MRRVVTLIILLCLCCNCNRRLELIQSDDLSYYDSLLNNYPFLKKDKRFQLSYAKALNQQATLSIAEKDEILGVSYCLESIERLDGNTKDSVANLLLAQNYHHLGNVFFDNHIWEPAIECFQHSSRYALLTNDSSLTTINSITIASTYYMTRFNDSAIWYIDLAKHYYQENHLNDPLTSFDLEKKHIFFAYNSKNDDIQPVLAALWKLIPEAEGRSEYLYKEVFNMIAEVYNDHHISDSALYYYEKGFDPNAPSVFDVARSITNICKANGDIEKIAYYADYLSTKANQMVWKTEQKTKLRSLYDDFKARQISRQKSQKYWIVIIVGIVVFIIVLSVLNIHFTKKKKLYLKDKKHDEWYNGVLQGKVRKLSQEAKVKEEKLKELQKKIDEEKTSPQDEENNFDDQMEELLSSPICIKILAMMKEANIKTSMSYPELQLTEEEERRLIQAVDAVFPQYSSKLLAIYPALMKADIIYCCLYLIGINERQAAALTGKSYNTVWVRSGKLHKIFNSQTDLTITLRHVVKSQF